MSTEYLVTVPLNHLDVYRRKEAAYDKIEKLCRDLKTASINIGIGVLIEKNMIVEKEEWEVRVLLAEIAKLADVNG